MDRMATGAPPKVVGCLGAEDILRARTSWTSIYVDERIKDYVVRLVQATRNPGKFKRLGRGLHPLRGLAPRHALPHPGGQGARVHPRAGPT